MKNRIRKRRIYDDALLSVLDLELLDSLADEVKSSADRASDAVDAMLEFVKQSEARIQRMDGATIKAMIETGRT